MPGTFTVEHSSVPSGEKKVGVLRLSGNVDASAVKDFEAAFDASLAEGNRNFVLDFTKVEYISSAGLRLLLKIRKAALDGGGRVKIAGLHREIRENVFDALGFSRLIELYSTADEATAAFSHEKS